MAREYPTIAITQEMINEAKRFIPSTRVYRTIASRIDTLTGHLGEFAFAQYFYGDWKKHRVGRNKGQSDFNNIEIKTSAFPFSEKLNLLVREDYSEKRKPAFYVQVIIDVNSRKTQDILAGTLVYICGFASAEEVDKTPMRDFGSKFGGAGGYKCHYISIKDLNSMVDFSKEYESESDE